MSHDFRPEAPKPHYVAYHRRTKPGCGANPTCAEIPTISLIPPVSAKPRFDEAYQNGIAGDYTGRIDRFNYRGQAYFEVHVYYYKGSEVGIYGK